MSDILRSDYREYILQSTLYLFQAYSSSEKSVFKEAKHSFYAENKFIIYITFHVQTVERQHLFRT